MMRRTVGRLTLWLVLCVSGPLSAWGQDPQFTQFYANPLYLNPAFAGTPHLTGIAASICDIFSR